MKSTAPKQDLMIEFEAIARALKSSPFKLNKRSRRGNRWSVRSLGWNYQLEWTYSHGWVVTPSNSSKSYQELCALVRAAVKECQ